MKIGEDLRRLLEKLADDEPVVRSNNKDELDVTIMRKRGAAHGEDTLKEKPPDDKNIVQTLVEKIPEEILRWTTFRKKKMAFRVEAEHPGPGQESRVADIRRRR